MSHKLGCYRSSLTYNFYRMKGIGLKIKCSYLSAMLSEILLVIVNLENGYC